MAGVGVDKFYHPPPLVDVEILMAKELFTKITKCNLACINFALKRIHGKLSVLTPSVLISMEGISRLNLPRIRFKAKSY